jgi:hypothetical protein
MPGDGQRVPPVQAPAVLTETRDGKSCREMEDVAATIRTVHRHAITAVRLAGPLGDAALRPPWDVLVEATPDQWLPSAANVCRGENVDNTPQRVTVNKLIQEHRAVLDNVSGGNVSRSSGGERWSR